MTDSIEKVLPISTYKKLNLWYENFGKTDYVKKNCKKYKELHKCIARGDDNRLNEKEKKLLEALLTDSAGIINRENLGLYFKNFKDIWSVQELQNFFEKYLSDYKFNEANLFSQRHKKYLENNKNTKLRCYYVKKQLMEKYGYLLEEYRFDEAEILIQKNKKYLDNEECHILWNKYVDMSIREEYESLLRQFDFEEADKYFRDNKDVIDQETYEKTKAKYIQIYFSDELDIKIIPDQEQSEAIGAIGENILVSARAGSGKTQTISGKVAFLVKKYGVNPDEILVLCFNNSSAEIMKRRIQVLVPEFQNAQTFHSWAWSIVQPPRQSVLFDNNKEFSPKEFSNFIKKLITEYAITNQGFKERIYNFFREEYERLDENLSEMKYFKTEEDRYFYLRNQTEITLRGDNVKSRGEKWIADYLFEHGIESYYEQHFSWDKLDEKTHYHPDFTIKTNDQTYILEHWGIDENDRNKEVPECWTKSWEEYKKEMDDKREYFRNNEIYRDKFIETSIRDISYDLPLIEQRKKFENILEERLKEKGIKCEILPKKELIKMAWESQLFTSLNTQMGQFIGWMQKSEWSESDLRVELEEGTYNKKQEAFCKIGLAIYEEYLAKLEDKIDFNILISRATKEIKKGNFDVSQFKYILIDEFQDFSQLFQNLIDSIQNKTSGVSMFCVGDHWQLINGFAGSDEKFFTEFKERASVKLISTCYRSASNIIENGNIFTQKYPDVFDGTKSGKHKKEEGEISEIMIDEVKIKNDSRDKVEDNEFKKYFRQKKTDKYDEFLPKSDYVKARYLKVCFTIIIENPGKTILFLNRKKRLKRIDLTEFFDRDHKKENALLAKCLREHQIGFPKDITFKTMHRSKGLEADIVVLLDVCEGTVPSIHPLNELFEIFGRTPNKIINEEKRLFYVAITRAKEQLFIITEKGRESEFIK